MPQGMRRCGFRQSKGRAQPGHRALDDARIEPLAARADEQWTFGSRRVGTEGKVGRDRGGDRWKHRDDPGLATLALDAKTVGWPPWRF